MQQIQQAETKVIPEGTNIIKATDTSSRSIPTQMVVTPLRVETPHSPRQPTNPNPIFSSMGEVKGVEVDHHHPSKDQATNGKSVMTALQSIGRMRSITLCE